MKWKNIRIVIMVGLAGLVAIHLLAGFLARDTVWWIGREVFIPLELWLIISIFLDIRTDRHYKWLKETLLAGRAVAPKPVVGERGSAP